MKKNKIEIEIDVVIKEINKKVTYFCSLYHNEPSVIVVPDYLEHFIRNYLKINTSITAFYKKEYIIFMGMLLIGTKSKTYIEQIEVF